MAKSKTIFVCQNCGAQSPKWLGQCPDCNQWNTFVENIPTTSYAKTKAKAVKPLTLTEVESKKISRTDTGIEEFDRVLGGGIVPGSIHLIAGDPGIGKSTLLSQLSLSLISKAFTVYYVAGEESPQQIKLRLERLGINDKNSDNFLILTQTDVDEIIATLEKSPDLKRSILIVDSIQTMTTSQLSGVAGSVGQTREATNRLIKLAKSKQLPVFLVGHVTKEGTVAGPKTLEHMVDGVFYFEGERYQDLRLLRSQKNRFGATDEVGVWQMTDKGLKEVKDPTGIWMDKDSKPQPGSAITVVIEGTRPLAIEIQSLVTESFIPTPKRVINGIEYNRGQLLLAVAQKILKLPLYKYDVFINISGGLKTNEPAADLAVLASIYSSFKNKPLPNNSVYLGEVSLLGKVRPINQAKRRITEAKSLGLKNIYDSSKISYALGLKRLI